MHNEMFKIFTFLTVPENTLFCVFSNSIEIIDDYILLCQTLDEL